MIYRWKCTVCSQETDIERPMADSTVPPEGPCPPWEEEHASSWQRIYQAPMQLKESYPDGHKRKGFAELKEVEKLKQKAAVTRSTDTLKNIAKEIKDIKRR